MNRVQYETSVGAGDVGSVRRRRVRRFCRFLAWRSQSQRDVRPGGSGRDVEESPGQRSWMERDDRVPTGPGGGGMRLDHGDGDSRQWAAVWFVAVENQDLSAVRSRPESVGGDGHAETAPPRGSAAAACHSRSIWRTAREPGSAGMRPSRNCHGFPENVVSTGPVAKLAVRIRERHAGRCLVDHVLPRPALRLAGFRRPRRRVGPGIPRLDRPVAARGPGQIRPPRGRRSAPRCCGWRVGGWWGYRGSSVA